MQAFTDAVPFSDRSDHIITMELVQGRRPPRPKHPDLTGRVWRLIQRCWDQDPRLRPEAADILQELRESLVSVLLRSSVGGSDSAPVCSNPPAWKLLIAPACPTDSRIAMITSMFMDRDEAEGLKYLSGGDARAFVDVIEEAGTPSPYNGLVCFD